MMQITREELAAWADGEITGARGEAIAAAVLADPELQAEVAAHRALKARLAAHFAPLAEAPVPDRLRALLVEESASDPAPVIDLAAARQQRDQRRLPRWTWLAAPALAASLALAVFLPRGGDQALPGYADAQLAGLLDSQLVATHEGGAENRVLLSFRNDGGEFCRAYAASEAGGIACRDQTGWRIEALGQGGPATGSQYQQAGASEIMAAAQAMANGPALDAAQEEAARASGWR